MTSDSTERFQMLEIFGAGVSFLAVAIGWVCFAYYTDYPGETLYVVSILCTMAITGFLSIYAWQQRVIKGALLFMLMELGVCFLALFEILSILSQTREQALFWFNMRFLLTAFIPVGWLGFVLTFSGQIRLISKPLVAGLLAIPFITQVMMWSNSLHGLWVTHDVGFHQTGPFWIAETSARVPAVWFMVHSFYSLLLGTTAAGLLLQVAWKKRQTYRAQALLLTVGTLISLSTSVIPIFNLISQPVFNPFIPGLGISALFYALAIFRFDFLKRFARGETDSSTPIMDPTSLRSMVLFIFIFLLMTTGLASIGYVSYQNYERQFRIRVESEISAIGQIKIHEVVHWRTVWQTDAEAFYENPVFAALVQQAFENPDDKQAQADLQAWLEAITNNYQYDRATLLDINAIERFSAPDSPQSSRTHLKDVQEVLNTKQITSLDLHRDSRDGRIHLAILIPLLAGENADIPVGVLYLRIDPEKYLYPFINEWPGASASAETLIVRRDGNDILYLNDLRFDPSAALNLRIPLSKTEVPAVGAANGHEGIVEGVDYRGVPVLADIHPVPNSPWFLVSKIDTAEVFAPLRNRAWETVFLVLAWVIGAGAGLGVIWRQQRLRHYREQYESAKSLRESEERYRELVQQASDGIFLADPQTNYIEVNPRGCDMMGYTRSELLTMKIADLLMPGDLEHNPPRLQELREGKTLITERRLKRKDGSLVPVEISARMFPDGHFQSIIRDITERKQAEERLQNSEAFLNRLIEQSPMAMWISDEKGTLIRINQACCDLLHISPAEVMGQYNIFQDNVVEEQGFLPKVRAVFEHGETVHFEIYYDSSRVNDLELHHTVALILAVTIFPIRDAAGRITNAVIQGQNITDQKQAEIKLRASELRFRLAAESLMDVIYEWDIKEKVDWYGEIDELMGYAPGTFPRTLTGWAALLHPDDKERVQFAINAQLNGEAPYNIEYRVENKNGEWRWWTARGMALRDPQGAPYHWIGSITDITERKRSEESIRKSEARFRALFEDVPIAIWEEDFSEVKKHLDSLKAAGIADFPAYFQEHPEAVTDLTRMIRVLDVNRSALTLYEAESKQELIESTSSEISPSEAEHIPEDLIAIAMGKPGNHWDGTDTTITGKSIQISLSWSVVPGHESDYSRVIVTTMDITELKQSEGRFAAVFNSSPNAIAITRMKDNLITGVNKAWEDLTGWTKEEVFGRSPLELGLWETPNRRKELELLLKEQGVVRSFELMMKHKSGKIVDLILSAAVIMIDNEPCMVTMALNITERKRVEREIIQRTQDLALVNTLNEAANRGESVETIINLFTQEAYSMFECRDAAIYLVTPDGNHLEMQNNSLSSEIRQKIEDFIGITIPRIRLPIREGSYAQHLISATNGTIVNDPAEIQKWVLEFTETTFLPNVLRAPIRTIVPRIINLLGVRSTITIPLVSSGQPIGLMDFSSSNHFNEEDLQRLLPISRQITALLLRKQAEINVEVQLKRITALNEIDHAIGSSLDMYLSLEVLLKEVVSQLGVDAADVLLMNPVDSSLEYISGRGFRKDNIRLSRVQLGEGLAGQVGQERRVVHIPHLSDSAVNFSRAHLLQGEGFVEYFGIPLLAKGALKGVLEIFNRTPLLPDPDWLRYLETLGGQAAIAIDSAESFATIQRSNQELMSAYDATIAGWSHAMDLRDKETEGHSQRVTETTLQLASRMGVKKQDQIHIRRGALLHDIGKLGVPDYILFKPGKLTEEEWEIMRKHPTHAYEMLLPIAYLEPALDIPYCHHEKWDGTGYPRGLKGEQIPLAARIFAVVDVWDALRSDRPYRPGWELDRIREYIRAESGKHFEPRVAEAFLKMLEGSPEMQ